jgi:hypothetical protein
MFLPFRKKEKLFFLPPWQKKQLDSQVSNSAFALTL